MDTLTALNNRLKQLKDKRKTIKSSISSLETRKKDVNTIIDKTTKTADNDYDDVNTQCTKIMNNIYDAISGTTQGDTIYSSVAAAKESDSRTDSDISTAVYHLGLEISHIGTKLTELNTELRNVETSINQTKERIQREKERQAKEALSKLTGGLIGG